MKEEIFVEKFAFVFESLKKLYLIKSQKFTHIQIENFLAEPNTRLAQLQFMWSIQLVGFIRFQASQSIPKLLKLSQETILKNKSNIFTYKSLSSISKKAKTE
ncbi:hypothetical protein BpHYR1_017559 [Brachionus plicatilis]|uniref:Uncharacterized protein n=1 Tax=Brachionus plicatilis TaxID=10195 RepID=A0A3M7PP04_BRAPC|nr:hypothetical protein BpHYR1_017559 [Brachionus plicatilis]